MATQETPYSTVPPPPPPPTLPPIPVPKLLLIVVMAIALAPSFLLMRLIGLMSAADSFSDFIATTFNGTNLVESQYRLQFTIQASAQRRLNAALVATASLLATLLVPALRSSFLLYSPLYKWSLLAVILFCAPYFINAAVIKAADALEPLKRGNKRWSYYSNILREHLGSALHSTLILLVWWFLHLSNDFHPITSYGAWVCGAWMIRCALILFNSSVMARWRANAVYDRYEERILRVGFQFHIMYALIPSAGMDASHMAPWRKKEGDVEIVQVASDWTTHVDMCWKVEDHIRYLSGHRITTQEVALITMHTVGLTTLLPPELGADLPDTISHELGISPDDGAQIDKTWLEERFRLKDEDARVLYGELRALVTSPDQVSFHTFATWMNGAYKDNVEVGQMLREEDNAILNSDRLLMALLINKAFFLWLFLTGKTTTQVFSVIPFVYFAKCFVDELFRPQFQMLIG